MQNLGGQTGAVASQVPGHCSCHERPLHCRARRHGPKLDNCTTLASAHTQGRSQWAWACVWMLAGLRAAGLWHLKKGSGKRGAMWGSDRVGKARDVSFRFSHELAV